MTYKPHNIGVIRLHRERIHNLNEVKVTASRIMMVMKGDTLVYDANAFQLAEGSMLDELIRQLPGVRLESGGHHGKRALRQQPVG